MEDSGQKFGQETPLRLNVSCICLQQKQRKSRYFAVIKLWNLRQLTLTPNLTLFFNLSIQGVVIAQTKRSSDTSITLLNVSFIFKFCFFWRNMFYFLKSKFCFVLRRILFLYTYAQSFCSQKQIRNLVTRHRFKSYQFRNRS